MSLHRTLSRGNELKRQRNVLTREERLAKLEDEGKWKEGESIFGLPKVLVVRARKKKKDKKEEAAVAEVGAEGAEGAAVAEGAEGAEGAAPAEGGPARGAKG